MKHSGLSQFLKASTEADLNWKVKIPSQMGVAAQRTQRFKVDGNGWIRLGKARPLITTEQALR